MASGTQPSSSRTSIRLAVDEALLALGRDQDVTGVVAWLSERLGTEQEALREAMSAASTDAELAEVLRRWCAQRDNEVGREISTLTSPGEASGGGPIALPWDSEERYQPGDILGRGGMGEVRWAHDRRLDRDVAVKRLLIEKQSHLPRFLREARLTARLEHPNIVPVHDIGIDRNGGAYFTMKRILGRSLSEQLRSARPPTRGERLRTFLKVCDAMMFAHAQGIVHRDVKASNVMVGDFGEVLVVDWGLAKEVDTVDPDFSDVGSVDPSLTRTGTVMGTPSSMAPEQAEGSDEVGPAADIYALGVLLYVLVVGRGPFADTPKDRLMGAVIAGDFPPPRTVEPSVPPELEAIVLCAMQRLPEDRYRTVADFQEDVSAYLEGRPVQAMQYAWWTKVYKWALRNRQSMRVGLLVLLVTGSLSALALGTGIAAYVDETAAARRAAEEASREAALRMADAQVALAVVRAADGRASEARTQLREALVTYEQFDVSGLGAMAASGEVNRAAPEAFLQWGGEDVSSFDWVSVAPSGDALAVLLHTQRASEWLVFDLPTGALRHRHEVPIGIAAQGLSWGDGRPVATSWVEGGLAVIDVVSGEHTMTIPLPGEYTLGDLVLMPAGGRSVVVQTRDLGVRAFSLPDGEPLGPVIPQVRLTAANPQATIGVGRLHPNSHIQGEETLLVDLRSGEFLGSMESIGSYHFTADGTRLAWRRDETVGVLSVPDLKVLWEAPAAANVRVMFVREGQEVLVFEEDRVTWHDATDGRVLGARTIGRGPSTSGGHVHASGDGTVVATTLGETLHVWLAGDRRAERSLHVTEDTSVTGIALSPDGVLLAAAVRSGELQLWDWRSGQLLRSWQTSPQGTRDVVFSPDGSHAVTADRDGIARVFDLTAAEPVRQLGPVDGVAMSAAWHPDGRRVLVGTSEAGVLVFDGTTGERLGQLHANIDVVWDVDVDEAGERVLMTGRNGGQPVVEVWDLETATVRMVSEESVPAFQGAFEPGGRGLAAAAHDGSPRVFPDASPVGQVLQSNRYETLLGIAYTPDGRELVTGAYDGRVQFWDLGQSRELYTMPIHQRTVIDLLFSKDGSRLFSAGGDGRVFVTALDGADEHRVLDPLDAMPPTKGQLHGLGDRAAARRDWQRALDLWSLATTAGAPRQEMGRARALWALGRYDQARAAARKAAEGGEVSEATAAIWQAIPK